MRLLLAEVRAVTRKVNGDLSRRGFMAAGASSVALLGIAAYTPAKAQVVDPKSVTLFTNVRLFDGLALNTRDGMSVLVADGMIADVAQGPLSAPDGATVIDGGGRTLMPGLIDAHWHTMLASLPVAVMMTADVGDIHFAAAAQAERTLMRGFTTVRDAGGPAFALKRAIDSGQRRRAADLSVGCDDLADLGPRRFPQHLGSCPVSVAPRSAPRWSGRRALRTVAMRCCRRRGNN